MFTILSRVTWVVLWSVWDLDFDIVATHVYETTWQRPPMMNILNNSVSALDLKIFIWTLTLMYWISWILAFIKKWSNDNDFRARTDGKPSVILIDGYSLESPNPSVRWSSEIKIFHIDLVTFSSSFRFDRLSRDKAGITIDISLWSMNSVCRLIEDNAYYMKLYVHFVASDSVPLSRRRVRHRHVCITWTEHTIRYVLHLRSVEDHVLLDNVWRQ